MITRNSLFRRNYFIFVSIIIIFIFMAFGSAWLVGYLDRPTTQVRIVRPPNYLFRNLYEQLDPNPIVAFKKLQASNSSDNFMKFEIVDQTGKSLVDGSEVLPRILTAAELDSLAQDKNVRFGESDFGPPKLDVSKTKFPGVYFVHRFDPPPGFFNPGKDGPPGPGGPGGPGGNAPPPPPDLAAGGPHPPPEMGPGGGPRPPGDGNMPPRMGPPRKNMVMITIGFLVIFTLVSVGIAMIYQFSRYRDRSQEAFDILDQLRHGNLSARMPSKKFDELAPLVTAFNQMADDVQSMVESLRKADQARRQLLQDLAHDLRTPLASLKTFLETLQISDAKISTEKRLEVISLCFSEVEYFGKLVEDLLFLAQITEPKYSAGTENIDLLERVQEQVTVFKNRYPDLQFEISNTASHKDLIGSSKLIDRLMRNAFENSASFARSKVKVEISNKDNQIGLSIIDDGPGFSAVALKEFGNKKASRILSDSSNGKRISVGIGSVIMKEILAIHSGEIKADNVYDQGRILGGKVSFWIPQA